MTETRFVDRAPISEPRKTSDGYLVAESFVARAGIQLYAGSEVGMPDRRTVRVWRPEDEVKAPDSVRTYSHAPVTLGHPGESVTKDNWSSLAKGEVSTEAEWVDGRLRLPLIVKDGSAIAAIDAGTRELSAGYTCRLEFGDGVTPEGEAYDAIQRDIRINHLAIVPRGRAGPECRIGDGAAEWGAAPVIGADALHGQKGDKMPETTKRVVIDGLTIETTDQGAEAIARLQKQMTDADAAHKQAATDAKTAHDEEVAAKDADIAKRDAEIDALKAKVLDGKALDEAVAARADLLSKASSIAPDVKTDGLSDAEIRAAVVKAKLGDAVDGKTEAYIDARFDILAEDAEASGGLRSVISGPPAHGTNDAQSSYVARMTGSKSA